MNFLSSSTGGTVWSDLSGPAWAAFPTSPLFTKMSNLSNATNYTSKWESAFNSETNTDEARLSSELGSTGLALKFYPTKAGISNANGLGLFKTNMFSHIIEGSLEAMEAIMGDYVRKNVHPWADFDDKIIDMHMDNANEYLGK
jgi:hypothetical protein